MSKETNPYYRATVEWLDGIVREGRENPNERHRMIAQAYLEHAVLEYTDRYPELLRPARMVEHPVYQVRLLTEDPVLYDGMPAVRSFYDMMNAGPSASNQDELLSFADWGFASFMKIVMFLEGPQANDLFDVSDADARYVAEIPIGMYWTYDRDLRVIGENVFQTGRPDVKEIAPEDFLTSEDLAALVEPYLPRSSEIGSSPVFSG